MLKLATILDNPGEPVAETRYRDPRELHRLGFNGQVLFETTALSGLERPDVCSDGEVRRWVTQHFELVRRRVDEARNAQLSVYLAYDVLSLPKEVVAQDTSTLTCKNRPGTLCPASEPARDKSLAALEALLAQLPEVDGIVLRFGDNDASRLPHLVGNDIYLPHCARCSHQGRAERILATIKPFYARIVEQFKLRLIVRAWNVRPNGLHDSVDLCRRVQQQLPGRPGNDGLVLSFKFTEADFWRYQSWNGPSLAMGERPIIYELECQREFEGKGTIPNWQVPLWRDGPPETPGGGLASVAGKINLAGLWAWVRGGGWGGPFVKDESWIDANVFAVPRMADAPDADALTLGRAWIGERLGLEDEEAAQALYRILEHSPTTVLEAFYIGPFAQGRRNPWHPSADWIQDDLVDAEAAWRMIQRLAADQLDEVVREKRQAVERLAADRVALQRLVTDENRRVLDPLVHSLVYAESLLRALHHLVAGLVAYRRFREDGGAGAAAQCRRHLVDAQSHWDHHTQRTATLSGVGTAFREAHFWELTQRILGEVG
jgi:hypothetical protein